MAFFYVRGLGREEARQLPQGTCCVRWIGAEPANAISATTELNCGSCRAPARLRRRRYCLHFPRLTQRYRSLAKARELLQGIGGVSWSWVVPASALSATTEINCGSCRAPARLRRRRYCWHFRRLTHRYRSLAKARQLPQGTCCVRWMACLTDPEGWQHPRSDCAHCAWPRTTPGRHSATMLPATGVCVCPRCSAQYSR